MYQNTKQRKCPKCGKVDIEESAYCSNCFADLLQNKVTETWSNWTFTKQQ